MLKKILYIILTIVLGTALESPGIALESKQAVISLDGIQLEMEAFVQDGTVYLPVRNLCENLGYTVQWQNQNNKQSVITKLDKQIVSLNITDQLLTQNGLTTSMDRDGCILENGHTYLKSNLFSKAYDVNIQYNEENSKVTVYRLLEKDTVNILKVGSKAGVRLEGNPTTGYNWHMEIGDDGIISKTDETYISNAPSDMSSEPIIGAGGTYIWTFQALKKGETTITFKYYRSWMGEDSATSDHIITYKVLVN